MAGTVNELKPYVRGGQLLGINRPQYTNNRVLAASTAEALAVPAGATSVLLTCTTEFYVDFVTTAVVPSGDVTDGSAPTLINYPALFSLSGATSISVISPYAATITASFYK